MDPVSRKQMSSHYSDLLKKYGPTRDALVYCNERQQITRYTLMAAIEPLPRDCSILDVGCGLGYFCDFLREHGWQGAYTGLDVCEEMVSAAAQRVPDGRFLNVDILTEDFSDEFDYVFCGATIQHRPANVDPKAYAKDMITAMFRLARRAVVFDIFSTRVDYMDENNLYLDPNELLQFCYSLTSRLVLRNDCRPFELMIYLFKNQDHDELNIFSDWQHPQPRIGL